MKWGWQSDAERRAAGTQKIVRLLKTYLHQCYWRYAPNKLDDPEPTKQRAKIEALLSDAGSFDPNLKIEGVDGLNNLLLLLRRGEMGSLVPKLFAAGFDSTLPEHRWLAGQMVALKGSLKETWDLMRKQGFDFSQPIEDGKTSLMAFAMRYDNKEALALLLEYGFDPLTILPDKGRENTGTGLWVEIDPIHCLIMNNTRDDRLVLLLLERGVITLKQKNETWSPQYFYSYNKAHDISMFSEHNVALVKPIYDRYASAIQAYRQAPDSAPNPVDGWHDKDLTTIFGCGLLPQALDPVLWQGREGQLYELYVGAPEHLKEKMQTLAADLLQIEEVKVINRIQVPAQRWGLGIEADTPAKGAAR